MCVTFPNRQLDPQLPGRFLTLVPLLLCQLWLEKVCPKTCWKWIPLDLARGHFERLPSHPIDRGVIDSWTLIGRSEGLAKMAMLLGPMAEKERFFLSRICLREFYSSLDDLTMKMMVMVYWCLLSLWCGKKQGIIQNLRTFGGQEWQLYMKYAQICRTTRWPCSDGFTFQTGSDASAHRLAGLWVTVTTFRNTDGLCRGCEQV